LGGGTMSGYGGEVDRSQSSAGGADLTQVNTTFAAYTSDTAYEPVMIGLTSQDIDSWLFVGDSIVSGADDIGIPSGSVAGAGDAYGNAGYAERAMGIKNLPYINLGKSGSTVATWATPGIAALRIGTFSQFCNKGLLALGRNDISGTVTTVIANLTTMYRIMAASLSEVRVVTIPPATTGTFATLEGQTVTANESKRLEINAWMRSGSLFPASLVFDLEAVVRDPTETGKWRVDGGPWTTDGTHPSSLASVAAGAAFAVTL
jgi:hypothetical protein